MPKPNFVIKRHDGYFLGSDPKTKAHIFVYRDRAKIFDSSIDAGRWIEYLKRKPQHKDYTYVVENA